ncbi:uncharacterized protein MKK02DRAFT_29961 [Dioszegia hungarica]|uniref:BTB domain-containing protein n=1 Tax=Dioszegia hungarica TaxID=4972 RepID=A0AA38H2K6_9TREE|nr:uncharacterized protein MKK02DRAFT_29961 [Dioszegia hungarica]KAI9632965.1 hypothetical protein MKK02DRAFT_29961 [Dioszegia hungarica]
MSAHPESRQPDIKVPVSLWKTLPPPLRKTLTLGQSPNLYPSISVNRDHQATARHRSVTNAALAATGKTTLSQRTLRESRAKHAADATGAATYFPLDHTSTSKIIFIQTEEDNLVPISRSLLVKYSNFIAELPSFLTSNGDDTHTEVIPLPSATSVGMQLVVDLLEAEEAGEFLHPGRPSRIVNPWQDLGIEDLQAVFDAMTIADAYDFDIPLFTRILLRSASAHQAQSPLLLWAVQALYGSSSAARDPIVNTFPFGASTVTPHTLQLLQLHIPQPLALLEAEQGGWIRLTDDFLQSMRSTSATPRWADVASSLGPEWHALRLEPQCPSHRDGGLWAQVRYQAADLLHTAIIQSRGDITPDELRMLIDCAVDCGFTRCSRQLYLILRPIIAEFASKCPKGWWKGR